MELFELFAHVAEHGYGVSTDDYTPEWAAANGLPLACDRCGLPFDRTGRTKHMPDALNAALIADGEEPIANTACPRFIGAQERWLCTGLARHLT